MFKFVSCIQEEENKSRKEKLEDIIANSKKEKVKVSASPKPLCRDFGSVCLQIGLTEF